VSASHNILIKLLTLLFSFRIYDNRLLHPLSPRGKLVHWGNEGLEASNRLIKIATSYDSDVQLRDELFRLAMNSKQAKDLQMTAEQLPNICQWINVDDLVSRDIIHYSAKDKILGALRLHKGCQVIHVPSYLQALWRACQDKNDRIKWKLIDADNSTLQEHLSDFDVVLLSCGSGLFSSFFAADTLPVQLVRGQSVEMRLPEKETRFEHGLLSGKYMSPLPDKSLVLIGASHEFQVEPLPPDELVAELRNRTQDMAPYVWSKGAIERITRGTRVQSQRGKHGRLPVVGRIDCGLHPNVWLFTGLSSRGLLYHALYGQMIAEAILANSEDTLRQRFSDIFWWRKALAR
jgi:glycine/D-amino acid oxidase-like deaminating enzyme